VSIVGPDSEELATLAKAHRDAARVNEKVKLATTKKGNPIEPLDTSREAGSVNCTRWEAVRRKCEAATAGTTERLLGDPGGCEECGEVSLKD
jgi:hypothetical protein